jgi:hypothetical protein
MPFRPLARDRIIQHMDWSQYPLFRRLVSETTSINWPYPESDIFWSKGNGREKVINPVFLSHVFNIDNWSVGSEVIDAFPFLHGLPTRG